MSRSEVFAKITNIVRTLFDEYEGAVTPDLNARQVEQWDSLANVQLMVMVEQAFKFRFTTEQISNLKNLDELTSLVLKKLEQ